MRTPHGSPPPPSDVGGPRRRQTLDPAPSLPLSDDAGPSTTAAAGPRLDPIHLGTAFPFTIHAPSSDPCDCAPPISSTTTSREAVVANASGGNDNTAAGSSSSSTLQTAGGRYGDADTGSAYLQPVDQQGHYSSSLSRGNDGSQSEDDDAYYYDYEAHGRPLVELMAIRADLQVLGTKIIVYDFIRGQTIYKKEEEQKEEGDQQAMDELVLGGPYAGISAYGCFAIQIKIPDNGGDDVAGGLIQWQWDCYDPRYGEEVDEPPVTHQIASLGPGRNVEVTYAVMSNALEATVQVMFYGLQDVHLPGPASASDVVVRGEVTARIQDFQVGSVLFRRTQWAGHCFSHSDGSGFRLELARNVLAVPCGSKLHIRVKLATKFSVTEADGNYMDVTLDFDNGTLARRHQVDGEKIVEVKICWYTKEDWSDWC